MPIYDYLCSNCGERTEVIHGITEPGPRFCPACGAEGTLRKAFAPPTVHFKGSGWAKKDRSTSGTKTKAKPDGESEADAAKAGTSGTSGGDSTSSDSTAAKPGGSTPAGGPTSTDGSTSAGGSTSSSRRTTDG